MSYSIKKLNKQYAKIEKFANPISHQHNNKQQRQTIISNTDITAYTDNGYKILMRELDNLYSVVDSLTLTEKFICGE